MAFQTTQTQTLSRPQSHQNQTPAPQGYPQGHPRFNHLQLSQVPRYSAQSFDTSFSASAYTNYSDSLLDNRSGIQEHDYDNSILISNKHSNSSTSESFGSRVFSAFTDAVRTPSATQSTLHSRARSIADSAGPMLARANTIRLGGLLNRTTPQKQSAQAQHEREAESDVEEPEDLPEYKPTFTSTPESSARRDSRPRTPAQPQSSKTSRFAWFTAQSSRESGTSSTSTMELSDPLLDLNVNAALFPSGATNPQDPASFNELLTNSCALISRLQTGYREKTTLLRQANAERDAAREETDEANVRVAHLRSQLETMAAKAAEQDKAMRDLAAELAATRARMERDRHDSLATIAAEGDIDDDATPRRRAAPVTTSTPIKSKSGRASLGRASDSGFESDAESTCESTAPSSLDDQDSCVSPQSQVKHLTPRSNVSTANAWGVVGNLQRENARLRGRVRELEGAVEGCLSLVR